MRRISAIIVLLLPIVTIILLVAIFLTASVQKKGHIMNEEKEAISTPEVNGVKDLTITVVYDNNPYKEGLQTGWGFGCVITGAEKTILFDTG